MIIFDDLKFREWIENNSFTYYKSRNHAFQALAKTAENEEELYNIMKYQMKDVNTDIDNEADLMERAWFYYNLFENRKPITPHTVYFDIREIEMIQNADSRVSKRINLALLFLFKYFNTSNIRAPIKELLLMTGSSCNRYDYKKLNFTEMISPCVSKIQIKDKKRIHARMYHYRNQYKNNDIGFTYSGDMYCVAGEKFNSNIKEFCDKVLNTNMRQISL